MKKILGLSLLLTVLVFGSRQIYWMLSKDGNLNISSYNSSNAENVNLEVFVHGESVFNQDHSNKNFDCQDLALFKSSGIYEIKVVAAEHGISKTAELNLWTVKWVKIEFVNNPNDPSKYDIKLLVESSPNAHCINYTASVL